jgi:hypothetical protein
MVGAEHDADELGCSLLVGQPWEELMKLRYRLHQPSAKTLRVEVVNPYPNKTYIPDAMVTRRIGPRPWSEMAYWENGHFVNWFFGRGNA